MARRTRGAPNQSTTTLRVDPVACDGVGICAHLAPDVVGVDSWGYPMLSAEPLRGRDLTQANRAVAACPRHALFLNPVVDPAR